MFERFTDRARRVVVLAQEEARMLNHNYIGTEHILLGLIHTSDGYAARALESLGIGLDAVRQQVREIIGPGKREPSGHIPFTPRAKKVLELSLREALQLGHNYIGTEHILLGVIREGEGVAAQILVRLGGDLATVRRRVIAFAPAEEVEEGMPHFSGASRVVARMDIGDTLAAIERRLAVIEAHLGIARPSGAAEAGPDPAGPDPAGSGAAGPDPAGSPASEPGATGGAEPEPGEAEPGTATPPVAG